MRKPKKLTKEQKEILADIVENYIYWKETKKNLALLFDKAERLRIPITQIAKAIGITKGGVHERYQTVRKNRK